MNRALSRHIGLYRPLGFKSNKYFCFHTIDPINHLNALQRGYEKIEMLNEIYTVTGMVLTTGPVVSYTKFSYVNYEHIHSEMVNMMNGEIIKHSNIKFWPIVTINDNNCVMIQDLDKFIIENVLETKE